MKKTGLRVSFRAKLSRPLEGGDWSFLRLPQEASEQLSSRSMVSVTGSVNGAGFSATLRPDGEGGHWLKVEPQLSEAAGIRPGQTVELEIEPVTAEPEPDAPCDLLEALASTPAALEVWKSTTALARRDWIEWLVSGKRAETRVIRMGKMMDMLSKGKRRICCFDRSGQASKVFSCPAAAGEDLEMGSGF